MPEKDTKAIKATQEKKKKSATKKKAGLQLTRQKAYSFLAQEGISQESTPVSMNFKFKNLLKDVILKDMEDIMDRLNGIEERPVNALYTYYQDRLKDLDILYIELHK